MNKSILIRGSIVMGVFLTIIGIAVGCSMIDKDDVEPQISNKDDVYLSLSDFDLTNQELWEVMKNVDGLNYLMDYVDEIILEDYISSITQAEVDAEILLLTYLTENPAVIAEIQEKPEINQEYIDAFRQNMIILGYNPDSPADLRAFVELSIAKVKMIEDYVLNAPADSVYKIENSDMETHYNSTVYNDACVLEVRFSGATEASLVFDHFNLVPNYDYGIGEYVGTADIETIATDDFDETNTNKLTDEEVFVKYIELYNYMNPWMDQIPTNISEEDFCADFSDIAVFNYEDMTYDRLMGDPNLDYSMYLFQTLDLTKEDTIPYSYNIQTLGEIVLLAYKLSEEERTPYEDLTNVEKADIMGELVEFYKTDSVINAIMKEKRDEVGLEIFDPYMKLRYEFEEKVTFENEGSDSLIAKFGDIEITADNLFDYMEARVGTFYSIEITKVKRLVLSDEYEDVYGTSRNYMKNNSDLMKEHRDELRTMKTIFSSNGYASYGFSSNDYTWEEFLFLAFSATSESDVIEQLFIVGNLQPILIYPTLDYDSVSDYIQDQIDNYFSLDVIHLLIFVDFDKDFEPDSFDDLRDEFNFAELAEYNTLKVAFENLVLEKYNVDGLDTGEIADEYDDSLIGDVDNEWAIFKQYGFQIMTESLTLDGGSLNYLNTYALDENFSASLKRIYDIYIRPGYVDLDEYVDTQLTVTDFGIHFIIASQGSAFEQPSAAFTVDPLNPNAYTDGSANPDMTPTEAQILLYNEIKFAGLEGNQADVILPNNVYSAIEAYYLNMFNAHFTQTGYSLITTQYILDNSPEYADNNSGSIELLEDILEALYAINFPDGFVIPTN